MVSAGGTTPPYPIGIRTTTPPMTSPISKSERGLSWRALWQLMHAGATATSGYTAVKYVLPPSCSSV
jgi:hypothetical protein